MDEKPKLTWRHGLLYAASVAAAMHLCLAIGPLRTTKLTLIGVLGSYLVFGAMLSGTRNASPEAWKRKTNWVIGIIVRMILWTFLSGPMILPALFLMLQVGKLAAISLIVIDVGMIVLVAWPLRQFISTKDIEAKLAIHRAK